MAAHRWFHPHHWMKEDELGYFAPKTWEFWRNLLLCLCIFSIVGHWLEWPYCAFMGISFGIVDHGYAVWADPWYVPYWVYGIGAVAMTLFLEPFKEFIVTRCKTWWGALLLSFVLCVAIAAVLETGIGLLINQPDAAGEYPFWDNSQLPLNILGQGWLINDLVIGVVATLYLWVLYPLICRGLRAVKHTTSNLIAAAIITVFIGCCAASYFIPGLAVV